MSNELRKEFEQWYFCPSNPLLAKWKGAAWEAFQAGVAYQHQQRDRLAELLRKVMVTHDYHTDDGAEAANEAYDYLDKLSKESLDS